MSAKVTPELRLKKLRRLEHNVICPNCGTTAPQGLGFGNVCVKFNTFICDLCKTSHQAISHRVKSITMSNWTHDEVNALTSEYSGGNEAALHIWLQNAPPFGGKYRGGSRPKEGDRIEIFKNFVADCYDKGMFRATTPFVPNSAPQAAAPVAKPPAAAASAPASLRAPKPAETVDFFDLGEPSHAAPASAYTGTDPFASGGTFGDASPKPPQRDPFSAHSNFSSTTDLLGVGNNSSHLPSSSSFNHSSSNSSTGGVAAAKTHNASSDLLFDAFHDTPPSTTPVPPGGNSSASNYTFDAFPTHYPPAPGPAQASQSGSSINSNSGFDFIQGDPFSTPQVTGGSGVSGVSNASAGAFSSFDSFSSQAAVAPRGVHASSHAHNGGSGFDFMAQNSGTDPFGAPRSAGSSITSSNVNSTSNSAYASNNDLFAFSATTSAAAAALSAPSPVSAVSAPAPAPVHDPFGSVLLQPTLTGGSTASSGQVSPTPASPYTPHTPSSVASSGSNAGPMGAGRAPMSGNGLSTCMNGTGMGMGMSGMHSGGIGMGGGPMNSMNTMNGMNRGVSPVPPMGMSGGIGYGTPAMGHSMGMGNSMGMGHSMGQPYQPMGQPYRAAPTATLPQRVDAIGDAFGGLSFSGGALGQGQGQGYRGVGQAPSSYQQHQQQQQPSSFDFVQSTVKQQLPPTAPSGRASSASPMGAGMGQGMGQGMGMGGYQQHQQYQYPPPR